MPQSAGGRRRGRAHARVCARRRGVAGACARWRVRPRSRGVHVVEWGCDGPGGSVAAGTAAAAASASPPHATQPPPQPERVRRLAPARARRPCAFIRLCWLLRPCVCVYASVSKPRDAVDVAARGWPVRIADNLMRPCACAAACAQSTIHHKIARVLKEERKKKFNEERTASRVRLRQRLRVCVCEGSVSCLRVLHECVCVACVHARVLSVCAGDWTCACARECVCAV